MFFLQRLDSPLLGFGAILAVYGSDVLFKLLGVDRGRWLDVWAVVISNTFFSNLQYPFDFSFRLDLYFSTDLHHTKV